MKIVPLVSLLFCFAHPQSNRNYHLDKEYVVASTGLISLTCGDARVVITGSDRKTAHVKIDHEVFTRGLTFGSKEFFMDVKENGGNLELREQSHSTYGIIGYSREKYTILLELPAGAGLSIHGDDGDYQVKNMAGSVTMSLDDANTELTGCTGDRFSFRVGDGTVRMDQGKGQLEINGNDADVFIRHGGFNEIHAAIDDGKLDLETSLSETGTYSLRATDGSVSFNVLNGGGNFIVRHDDGRVSTEGNFKVVEKSDDETRLTLFDGKASIDIQVNDGRVKLVSAKAPSN